MKLTYKKLNNSAVATPILILIMVVVLAVVGGVGYYVYQEQQTDDENQSTSQAQQQGDPEFTPFAMDGLSYEATISTTQDGQPFEAVMQSDGQGNFQVTSTFEGQEARFVYTPDSTYSCSGNECMKMSSGQGGDSGLEVDEYVFGESELEDYRNRAQYQGRQDCPAGTCDVWMVSDEESGQSMIYIDVDSKRISQINSTYDGVQATIIYEYKDVSIEIPTNARELDMPTVQ